MSCNASFMAEQSPYIANTPTGVTAIGLSSQPCEIELPGIDPRTLHIMISILDSQHVLPPGSSLYSFFSAAEGFHRYEFDGGFLACDILISRMYTQAMRTFDSDPMETEAQLDSLIQQSDRCYRLPFILSKAAISNFLRRVLEMQEDGSQIGPLVLNGQQAKILANGKMLCDQWTKQKLLDPSFPELFLDYYRKEHDYIRFDGQCELNSPP